MITLRQLRYLDALARNRHFGRAATECSVTQPALSQQLQELERHVGAKLAIRQRDGIELTSEGLQILDRARRILFEVREIEGIGQHRSGQGGEFRIGVIPTIGPYLLPLLLPAIKAEFPQASIHVRETQTSRLMGELADGALDIAIAALPLKATGLEMRELFVDRFLLVSPRDRPQPPTGAALMRYFEDEQLLLLEEGNCLRDQALTHCDAAGIRYGRVYGTSNITTLVQMVQNGLGVTLAPELSLPVEFAASPTRLTRFAEPQPYRTIAAAWRRAAHREAQFEKIAQLTETAGRTRLNQAHKII